MTKELSERRAKDRETMACMVENLAAKHGWSAERCEFNTALCTRVDLTGPRGLSVGVEFEKVSPQPDNYCLAWHFTSKGDNAALLSDAFGRHQGSPVNSSHRRKCTAFARGIDTLLDKLETAMQMCIYGNSPFGNAFTKPAAFIMKNCATYHPAGTWQYVLFDEDMKELTTAIMLPKEAVKYAAINSLKTIS